MPSLPTPSVSSRWAGSASWRWPGAKRRQTFPSAPRPSLSPPAASGPSPASPPRNPGAPGRARIRGDVFEPAKTSGLTFRSTPTLRLPFHPRPGVRAKQQPSESVRRSARGGAVRRAARGPGGQERWREPRRLEPRKASALLGPAGAPLSAPPPSATAPAAPKGCAGMGNPRAETPSRPHLLTFLTSPPSPCHRRAARGSLSSDGASNTEKLPSAPVKREFHPLVPGSFGPLLKPTVSSPGKGCQAPGGTFILAERRERCSQARRRRTEPFCLDFPPRYSNQQHPDKNAPSLDNGPASRFSPSSSSTGSQPGPA
ncbi:translation initiation factor IF-2-like [Panthera tigris]|uniref:translation initiation factor IF-2-like n=1 Tax=Panthera tigris TaxID=9694 RepID=UPI001C6F810A|nr:translation initiation factor IF-2-like [Panthera tigris]